MKFIDCSACIGESAVNRLIVNHENYPVYEKVKQPKNAEELLAEMDYNGINYTGRLHGTIVVAPPFFDESFRTDALRRTIKKYDLFGVRANPKANRYMFDAVTMKETAEMLIEEKIPVYLSPDCGWEEIFGIMKEFPALTAIVTNYGLWGSDGYVYPLAKAYENLYFDTSDFQETSGIEAFVNRFGSDKLLFGTNFPMDNMGGPMATLLGANIPLEDKEKIAYGNIERLLGERKL